MKRIAVSEAEASSNVFRFFSLMFLIAGSEGLLLFLTPLLDIGRTLSAVLNALALSILIAPAIYRNVVPERLIRTHGPELQIYKELVEGTQQGIMVTDPQLTILSVNGGFVRITGYSEAEVLGKTPRLLQSGKQGSEFYQGMWHAIFQAGQWRGEIWNKKKDGTLYAE